MKKWMVFGVSLIALLFVVSLVCAVRINEVMYAPNSTQGGSSNEWIEIYNPTSESLNISGWKIKEGDSSPQLINFFNSNTTIIESYGYFIIAKKPTNFSQYFNCSCKVAERTFTLSDDGENISLVNSSNYVVDSINYSNSLGANGNGKSLQFCNNSWIESFPTPGSENNCLSSAQTCIQNWSCMNWGTCSNGIQTRTCIDLNNCSNATGKPAESQSCTNSSEIYLNAKWDEDTIINGEEFEIEVKAYNLKDENYDIKIYIKPEDEEKVISETYNKIDEKWISGNYYVNEILEGEGDKSENLKLRIKSSYRNLSGDAEIVTKIRKSGTSSIIDEVKESIEILEKENNSKNDTKETQKTDKTVEEKASTAPITGSVIKLGNRSKLQGQNNTKEESKVLYESASEKMKKYAIYALNVVLIFIIILLIMTRKKI